MHSWHNQGPLACSLLEQKPRDPWEDGERQAEPPCKVWETFNLTLSHQLCNGLSLTLEHPAPSPPPSQEKRGGKGRGPHAAQTAWHRTQLISGFPLVIPALGKWVFLLNCLLQISLDKTSNINSGVWSCLHSKKERTDQKSFLLLPLAAEGQQQLETRIYLAPNHSPGQGASQSPALITPETAG